MKLEMTSATCSSLSSNSMSQKNKNLEIYNDVLNNVLLTRDSEFSAVQNRAPSDGNDIFKPDMAQVKEAIPPSQGSSENVWSAPSLEVDYENFVPSGGSVSPTPPQKWEFCEANRENQWTGSPIPRPRKDLLLKKKVFLLTPASFKKSSKKKEPIKKKEPEHLNQELIMELRVKSNIQFHPCDKLKSTSNGSFIPTHQAKD